MHRQLFHSGLIPQNTSFGTFTAGVYGQHGQFSSFFFEYMQTEYINRRTLSGTGHSADTDTDRITRIRKAFFNDLLCQHLMFRLDTFYQRDRLAQHGHIAFHNTFHILGSRILTTFGFLSQIQIRINNGGLFHSLVHS